MALRYLIGDFRTGRGLLDIPITAGPWERQRNAPGTIEATLNLADPTVRALDLRNLTSPVKTFLAVLNGDTFIEAGPIWRRQVTSSKREVTLSAVGMWSYFDHRYLLPLAARATDFYIPDRSKDAEPGDLIPNPALDTNLAGLSLGTIAKRWVQQARTWGGGDVPVVFMPDEFGIHERNTPAVDFQNLGDSLHDLTDLEDGPDIEFRPLWTDDGQGVEWLLRTGTNAEPRLRSKQVHLWDFSAPKPGVKNLDIDEDATNLVSTAWTTGGRSSNTALVSHVYADTLPDAGYPMLEDVDSTHSTVSRLSTLNGYGRERLRVDSKPRQFFTFDAATDRAPYLNDLNVGDLCDIRIGRHDWLPRDTYRAEIASISGDHHARFVKITTGEVL